MVVLAAHTGLCSSEGGNGIFFLWHSNPWSDGLQSPITVEGNTPGTPGFRGFIGPLQIPEVLQVMKVRTIPPPVKHRIANCVYQGRLQERMPWLCGNDRFSFAGVCIN